MKSLTLDASTKQSWQAVAEWYHGFFTGLLLFATSRCGGARAAELNYRIFSRQREQRFLPGLRKLGLESLPHAVAAAQYHYLSNNIGGVSVEFMPESNRKAWVRYRPPRWIWAGTALCGIAPEVSTAMLRGWHAQNGVSLGNSRLGFVCTKQTVFGQSSLEGYYYEYDRPLAPEERLRFALEEEGPDFDPSCLPVLPSDSWPEARLEKAKRNYAMEYVRTALPVAVEYFGADAAAKLFTQAARMVGMQFYHQTASVMGLGTRPDAQSFALFMQALAQGQDDVLQVVPNERGFELQQTGWTLFREDAELHPVVFEIWNGLLEGALMAHNHRLKLSVLHASSRAPFEFRWRLGSV